MRALPLLAFHLLISSRPIQMEQLSSARYREEAERAERLADLAVGDDLRRELLEIAAEFRRKSEVLPAS